MYLEIISYLEKETAVLVPFYRGAVVFEMKLLYQSIKEDGFSSPFIEERLYFMNLKKQLVVTVEFSSPFIEERLYLLIKMHIFLL